MKTIDKATELQQAEEAMRKALERYNEVRINVIILLRQVKSQEKDRRASLETDMKKILNEQNSLNIAKAQAFDFMEIERWTRLEYEKAFEVYANAAIEADGKIR